MDIHGRPSNTMQSMVIHGHHFAGVTGTIITASSGHSEGNFNASLEKSSLHKNISSHDTQVIIY